MGPEYQVIWHVSPNLVLHGASSLLTGLGSLAREGRIVLSLVSADRRYCGLPHVMVLTVTDVSRGIVKSIAFDTQDRPDEFNLGVLETVDFYFKQSFRASAIGVLDCELAAKVRPAGLIFSVRGPGTIGLILKASLRSTWIVGRHGTLGEFSESLSRLWRSVEMLEGALEAQDWEGREDEVVQPRVVYQTRLWPETDRPERASVNIDRIAVSRALRQAFGTGDTIGVIPTRLGLQMCRDQLLGRAISRRQYARQLRSSLVAVNTHGLDGSPGYKIAESLAAGAALVSQPFLFELPEPLVPGVHYLPFETPEECVSQCRRLLTDRDMAMRMRVENRRYYSKHVAPAALATNILRASTDAVTVSEITGVRTGRYMIHAQGRRVRSVGSDLEGP